MIFISTGGRRDQTATRTALQYYDAGIRGVELSGGLYSQVYENEIGKLPSDLNVRIHNYFPPPNVPFVFNLASNNYETYSSSLSLAREGMRLANLFGNKTYSFHAGFRIDPNVTELGSALTFRTLVDREMALRLFADRVKVLASEAARMDVTLLIENNVLDRANFATYGENPLLLVQPDEIEMFMRDAPGNVGLLLDVAHLKVSSITMGFDLVAAHKRLSPWIRGYHLSDNDGSRDSNEPVLENSWFWSSLVGGLNYYSLEVYGLSANELVFQRDLVDKKIYGKAPSRFL